VTTEGLVMMVCARLRILEPLDFGRLLSPAAQDMWIQFELDMFTGAYQTQERGRNNPGDSRAAEAAWIADQAAKAVSS
jgi:hypothetical protein